MSEPVWNPSWRPKACDDCTHFKWVSNVKDHRGRPASACELTGAVVHLTDKRHAGCPFTGPLWRETAGSAAFRALPAEEAEAAYVTLARMSLRKPK